MIRGLPIRGGRHYEYMPIDNKLNISCYNIDDSCVNNIANVIQKFGPLFIHAYPSSLKILTELFIKHDVDINLPIKAIFLGSEYLTDSDKDLFSSYYKTKIVNWYGHSERLIHGGYCNENDEYHFYPFYGHIELIDQNDNVIRDPNIPGRIIATGFDNDVMPLIRYDTGDIGMWSDSEKCNCNRQMPIISKILGRTSDYIILSDKTKVSLTAFIFGQHFKEFVLIKEFQIVQNRIGFIEILMVPKEPFDKNIEHNFINKLKKSVQNKLQIKIIYVLNIKKTIRGKHRFLIQNVTE
jgi:phenylacetate-CoA ligase